MTLDDQRAMRDYIERHREQTGPFDIVRATKLPVGDVDEVRSVIAEWADAGVTWWIIGTTGRPGAYAEMRDRILRGPPSV